MKSQISKPEDQLLPMLVTQKQFATGIQDEFTGEDFSDQILINKSSGIRGLGFGYDIGLDYLQEEDDSEGLLPPNLDFDIDFDSLGKRKKVLKPSDFEDETLKIIKFK